MSKNIFCLIIKTHSNSNNPANIILNNGYHRFYSSQAITQLTEQIFNLREQQQSDQLDFIDFLKDLELPINLDTDYKIYSIRDLIDQIENLPEIGEVEDSSNEGYENYNIKRQELLNKIKKINDLKRKTEIIRNYKSLIDLKIGGRSNIQKNIQTSTNTELSNEITKLKINLERYRNLDDSQKKKLKSSIRGYDDDDV